MEVPDPPPYCTHRDLAVSHRPRYAGHGLAWLRPGVAQGPAGMMSHDLIRASHSLSRALHSPNRVRAASHALLRSQDFWKASGRLLKALRAACLYELSLRAFYAQAQALHPVLAGSSIQACQISIDGHGVARRQF